MSLLKYPLTYTLVICLRDRNYSISSSVELKTLGFQRQ